MSEQRERGVWVARSQGGASVFIFSSELASLRKAVELGAGARSVAVPYGEDARSYEPPGGDA